VEKLLADKEEAIQRNEENLKSSKQRAGAGVATAADSLQFELQRTLLSQELKKLVLEKDLLRNSLSVAIGEDDHESLGIRGDFPAPEDPSMDKAGKFLEVSHLRAREDVLRAKEAQAKNWWQPKVDVYSSYGLPSFSDEFSRAFRKEKEWTAGIRIGIDLGEGFESRNEAKAKAYEANALERRAAHRQREAEAADHELRHDMKLLRELILAADQDLGKAEKFLKLTEVEYNRGVKNGPDLLGAFQKFYEFREKRISLYREFHETKAELAALTASEN
jgi:outer membrane protein